MDMFKVFGVYCAYIDIHAYVYIQVWVCGRTKTHAEAQAGRVAGRDVATDETAITSPGARLAIFGVPLCQGCPRPFSEISISPTVNSLVSQTWTLGGT